MSIPASTIGGMSAWYTHDHKPTAGPQPLPREPLWTLWQSGRRVDASVLIYLDGGVELQLHCDGTFFSGMRAYNRENAVVLANRVFGYHIDLGWTSLG
jgi:hypothetical protein